MARTTTSKPRRRRRPQNPGPLARFIHRTILAERVLIAFLLFAVLVILDIIGAPPWLRFDALWVNDHRVEVRWMLRLTAIALALTAGDALLTRRPLVPLLVWLVWIGVVWALFADRVFVILRVVRDHA
ncbi:MAG: hypothetical protein KC983_03180 [Phycisphaerales bacterium]|nr:hypothetical protein [Phycisphaerales bacterium]